MLNAADDTVTTPLQVIDYTDPVIAKAMQSGVVNTEAEAILANIRSSIRRGHPQMRQHTVRPERIVLVGSGPSLNDGVTELRDLLWGAECQPGEPKPILVTVNGAYHWCLEHGFQPNTQIVMDARAVNARFVEPAVPKCNYVLASQCAPEVWDAVAGRPHVWIFHCVQKGPEDASAMLDAYYAGHWMGTGGGTTVTTRALCLLRQTGYVKFELFGIDCCWRERQHHALPQPENAREKRYRVVYGVADRPETQKQFWCAAWHVKQLEDCLALMKLNGQHFLMRVHGDGLLAYAMETLGTPATLLTSTEESD